MRYYIGQTDYDWFNYLSQIIPEDVNFWRPGGKTNFKVLQPGEPFLLKLKSPYNVIAGVGFFSSHTFLPISVAWDAFGSRNGCSTFEQLQAKILAYRSGPSESNPVIGCTVLTNPIFFDINDWVQIPENWSNGELATVLNDCYLALGFK